MRRLLLRFAEFTFSYDPRWRGKAEKINDISANIPKSVSNEVSILTTGRRAAVRYLGRQAVVLCYGESAPHGM